MVLEIKTTRRNLMAHLKMWSTWNWQRYLQFRL